MYGEFLHGDSGVQVVDQERAIGRSHSNQGCIAEPVLGGEWGTHAHTHGHGGKPHPQVPQDQFDGEQAIHTGGACSESTI